MVPIDSFLFFSFQSCGYVLPPPRLSCFHLQAYVQIGKPRLQSVGWVFSQYMYIHTYIDTWHPPHTHPSLAVPSSPLALPCRTASLPNLMCTSRLRGRRRLVEKHWGGPVRRYQQGSSALGSWWWAHFEIQDPPLGLSLIPGPCCLRCGIALDLSPLLGE